ncbi:MAG: hypothetical protein HDR80_04870 [Bacteroides sp.]|nr:hypothetical protein [Bacteroides sp.]
MADSTLIYDDSNLLRLWEELDPKVRLRALRGAFRREASKVRREAIGQIRTSIRSSRQLEKGVRAMVFKKKAAGFRVTVGTKRANRRTGKGARGYHRNRRGQEIPILVWADAGTVERTARKRHRVPLRTPDRWATTRNRGRMRTYGFMRQTLDRTRGQVTEDLRRELADNIIKTAKKYGCK